MQLIKIGTIIGGHNAPELIRKLAPLGFECFQLSFWENIGGADLPLIFRQAKEAADETGTIISSAGVYGNALENQSTIDSIYHMLDNISVLGTDLFTGFAGRVSNRPIEESMPRFKEVWSDVNQKAKDKGIRIAFENCEMGGNWHTGGWNIAFNPNIWEMMFNEINSDNIGLEWEPCHQLVQLIDPIPQLKKWAKKIFHVHGKDANIDWDTIKTHGIKGPRNWAWQRTPGFGDTNWTQIITILMLNNYKGTIDIEGFHDPIYKNELEYTGQVSALKYLKTCCGGERIEI